MSDLISRADAIKAIRKCKFESVMSLDWYRGMECAQDIVKGLPSADAVQGEWIEKGGELVCSVCGNSVSFSRTPKGWVLGKFCQTCGTQMKGGAE